MEERDALIVHVQLGRPPRGRTEVAARCPYGLPLVVRTDPLLDSGEPFPTLYWLVCPAATKAIGTMESEGRMRELNERLSSDAALAGAYRIAHEAYVAERDAIAVLPARASAGGMPDRVKCLHALYAHEAATARNPIGAMVREEIEPLDCPGPCVEIDAHGAAHATPGHPHLRAGGGTVARS